MVEIFIEPTPSGKVVICQENIDSWVKYWISQGILDDQNSSDENEDYYDYKSN